MPIAVVKELTLAQEPVRTKALATLRTKATYDIILAAWDLHSDVLVEFCSTVAGAIPQVRFRHHYGRIIDKDEQTVATIAPIDIANRWCHLTISPYDVNSPDISWLGVVVDEKREHYGSVEAAATGDQVFTAYGFEYVLSRIQIDRTRRYDDDASTTFWFNRGLSFNDYKTDRLGSIYASGNKHPLYNYFATDLSSAVKWSASNIVAYIFSNIVEESAITGIDVGIDFDSSLDYYPQEINVRGATVFDVLNQLFNRKRGLMWWMDYDIATALPVLRVRSVSAANVFIGQNHQVTIENDDRLDVHMWADLDLAHCEVTESATKKYDQIKVTGGKQGAVFTLQTGEDGDQFRKAKKNWTDADEQKYLAGASNEPDYAAEDNSEKKTRNDLVRTSEALRHVFTRFKMPQDWDGKTDIEDEPNAFPDFEHPDEAFTGTLAAMTHFRKLWVHGMRFKPFIPLKESFDYTTTSSQPQDDNPASSLPSFERPICALRFLRKSDNRPIYIPAQGTKSSAARDEIKDKGGMSISCALRVHDQQFGFSIEPHHVPHQLDVWHTYNGGPSSSEAALSHVKVGSVDYKGGIIVTLYAECDYEIAYKYPETDPAYKNNQRQVLNIRLGDLARVDYLVPYSVVGYSTNVNNKCLKQAAPLGKMLRDDRGLLIDVARAAWRWYGQDRRAVVLSYRRTRSDIKVGQVISTLVVSEPLYMQDEDGEFLLDEDGQLIMEEGSWALDINSVVSSVEHDLENGGTVVRTEFMEIDFVSSAGEIGNV